MHIVIYAIYMHLYFRTIFAVFWEPRCLNTTRIWKMLDKTICLMCLKHSSKTTVPKESPHCKVAKIWGSSSYLCTWNLYLFSAFFFWKSEIASTRKKYSHLCNYSMCQFLCIKQSSRTTSEKRWEAVYNNLYNLLKRKGLHCWLIHQKCRS